MNAPLKIGTDLRERSDTYAKEVSRQGGWRIAVCRDDLQWLLQRQRVPKEGARAAWDSVSFCRTRATLVRLWRAHTGGDGPVLLALLPEHFGRGP